MDRFATDSEVIIIDDIYNLPIESGKIEIVILSRMLGDIPDQKRLMREIARVLQPGGKVLIYEAISYPQHDLPHDYWRVLPGGLMWTAEHAGLELEELIYCGGFATQFSIQINNFIIGELGGFRLTRPIAACLRVGINLTCGALDKICPRPELASDYFVALRKPEGD